MLLRYCQESCRVQTDSLRVEDYNAATKGQLDINTGLAVNAAEKSVACSY